MNGEIERTLKIRCVTYKDEFSCPDETGRQNAVQDLLIGVEHRTVGCNSKVFGSSKPGDIVIITAKNRVIIGVLTQQLESCTLWKDKGGLLWEYNFEYKPLSDVVVVDEEFKRKKIEICTRNNVKPEHLFHSRFCGIRYKETLIEMFREKLFVTPI